MIYTSRYANPELKTGKYTVVGVTRSMPRFPLEYCIAGNVIEIAPPGYLFNEYDRGRFTPRYFKHLDSVGVAKILESLLHYQKMGKDVVLCCYEDVRKENEWCHRLVFAEWWLANTGEPIGELVDTSKSPRRESLYIPKQAPNPPEEKPEELDQTSLW